MLGPGPAGGLIVEDLTGRGRVILPADYLAEHAEYGWASTIDGAQGVTADLGLVLVRPGMDREHFYVAMTRGRHSNHAYITPDPSSDPEQHGHQPSHTEGGRSAAGAEHQGIGGGVVQRLAEETMQVLRTVVQVSGAQDAAHTALANARDAAAAATRQAAQQQAAHAEAQRRATRQLPVEHLQTLQQLTDRHARHAQLRTRHSELATTITQTSEQLQALPRWARNSRRQALHDVISGTQQQLSQIQREQTTVGAEIERLTRQVNQQAQQRDSTASAAARAAWAGVWDGSTLTSPRPINEPWPSTPRGPDTRSQSLTSSTPPHHVLPPQPGRGRGR